MTNHSNTQAALRDALQACVDAYDANMAATGEMMRAAGVTQITLPESAGQAASKSQAAVEHARAILAAQPTPEPVAQANADRHALTDLRRVMHGWHERAVALGADGVNDVLHAAEVAKKRSELRTVDGFISDWKLPYPAPSPVALQGREAAAISTLERLGYTHDGAELWKPPIGKAPAWATATNDEWRQFQEWRAARASLPAGGVVGAAAPSVRPSIDEDTELLPCPFCGSDNVSLSQGSSANGAPWFYIECEDCSACAETNQWNKRTIPPLAQHADVLERCAQWCQEQATSDWYGRTAADMVRAYAAATPQPSETQGRRQMTEEELVACLVKSSCIGKVNMSYESGPYSITRPSLDATRLKDAIEAHHGIPASPQDGGEKA